MEASGNRIKFFYVFFSIIILSQVMSLSLYAGEVQRKEKIVFDFSKAVKIIGPFTNKKLFIPQTEALIGEATKANETKTSFLYPNSSSPTANLSSNHLTPQNERLRPQIPQAPSAPQTILPPAPEKEAESPALQSFTPERIERGSFSLKIPIVFLKGGGGYESYKIAEIPSQNGSIEIWGIMYPPRLPRYPSYNFMLDLLVWKSEEDNRLQYRGRNGRITRTMNNGPRMEQLFFNGRKYSFHVGQSASISFSPIGSNITIIIEYNANIGEYGTIFTYEKA